MGGAVAILASGLGANTKIDFNDFDKIHKG